MPGLIPWRSNLFTYAEGTGMCALVGSFILGNGSVNAMDVIALHRQARHRACRTEILTRSASNAPCGIDYRNTFHEHNRLHGTVTFARRAGNSFLRRQTALPVPHSSSNVRMKFLILRDGNDRPGGAYLATARTGGPTVAMLETHLWLKEAFSVERDAQYLFGAAPYTQLTANALSAKRLQARRTCRNKRFSACRHPWFADRRITTIRQLLGGNGRRPRLKEIPACHSLKH